MTTTITEAVEKTTRSPRERRIIAALFAAGLTTFASMYSAQALLPSLSAAFGATPAHAALAVSLTTGLLALAIIPVSALSSRIGRTRVMIGSAITCALIGVLLPLSPNLEVLLAGRALQGVALAGVPAVAMAYLAEEIESVNLGSAMGIYVAGNTIGGLLGRMIPSFTLTFASWRWADAVIAIAAALCTVWFVRALPASRGFVARPSGVRTVLGDLFAQLRNPRLLALFGLAFVLMGGFVSVYNFLGYRLIAAPFHLPDALAGMVFVLYLSGTAASAVSGRLVDRVGRQRVLIASVALMAVGLFVTVADNLAAIICGILIYTAGFFGAHTTASTWVGAMATNRGAASSLYMFAYYLGSSILGATGGFAYAHTGWPGLTYFVTTLLTLATILITTLTLSPRRTKITRT
ncbi:MFS transporter [Nocardia callitridis]|uniref:MFS transporter n=1 Tax=Nocardia callitridis TaxID=648753 RepID=A0ABP9L2X0_9NOCA